MSFDLSALSAAVAAYDRVARVVVIASAGSVPRGPGTSMLVWENGQSGTIGGGALEWDVMRQARAMLAQGGKTRCHIPLGPTLGQCCGGAVTLGIEVFDVGTLPPQLPFARQLTSDSRAMPDKVARKLAAISPIIAPIELEGWLIETVTTDPRHVWIYGAGHVGRALVQVLHPLPDISITWVDTDTTRFPDDVPAGVSPFVAADPVQAVAHAPTPAEHLILTYSHAMDLALCHAVLSRDFASVGVIGSATKWARFRSRLAALGHSTQQIARVACPIGDPSLGKHPQAIALGVAAAILGQTDNRMREGQTG